MCAPGVSGSLSASGILILIKHNLWYFPSTFVYIHESWAHKSLSCLKINPIDEEIASSNSSQLLCRVHVTTKARLSSAPCYLVPRSHHYAISTSQVRCPLAGCPFVSHTPCFKLLISKSSHLIARALMSLLRCLSPQSKITDSPLKSI